MRSSKIAVVPQESIIKDGCRHYWIIESAHGPTSKGVCKFCAMVKEFHNSWPYFPVVEKVPQKSTDLTEIRKPAEESIPNERN